MKLKLGKPELWNDDHGYGKCLKEFNTSLKK